MTTFRIVTLPGDGIGPEVVRAAVAVLVRVVETAGHRLVVDEQLIGGAAIDRCGEPFPQATRAACADADALLLGAVGGPRWDDPRARVRPEQGLLAVRRAFGLFANLRPVRPHPALLDASPLRAERLRGTDLLFVRELTGGIYFGEKQRDERGASDVCRYETAEIERVARRAAALARDRSQRLVSVDKANVLETSRLWREVATRVVREEFPEVELQHVLVDAMAMHLLARPADFDVIVTENLFGDVLTDEAAMLAGSLGMLPSAALGENGFGLYEPVHGSAPELAGRDVANPYAAMLSAALLLRHSLNLPDAAAAVESAVDGAIAAGVRTADLVAAGETAASTSVVTEAVVARLANSN